MNVISLRTIIDDILLIVRNNNISESEDFSRELIAQWVKLYKAALTKEELESEDDNMYHEELSGENLTETGPLELEKVESLTNTPLFTKKTVDKLDGVYRNLESSIFCVTDQEGCNIQKMNKVRRHLHYFRKHTSDELTYYYEDGYIYVLGTEAYKDLQYIWVSYYEDDTEKDDEKSEDEIKIPTWMVPTIKDRIFKSELAFMLNRPSDDSNNATLASVKPHGPQDLEK